MNEARHKQYQSGVKPSMQNKRRTYIRGHRNALPGRMSLRAKKKTLLKTAGFLFYILFNYFIGEDGGNGIFPGGSHDYLIFIFIKGSFFAQVVTLSCALTSHFRQ